MMKLPKFSFKDEGFWLAVSTYALPVIGILLYLLHYLLFRLFKH